MEIHLKFIGCILIALSTLHLVFPRYFSWKTELSGLTLINKQLMYIHTFFIGLTVLLMGIFCLYSTADIVHTRLGRQFSFGLFVFWGMRLIIQFFGYSAVLWKGKWLETAVHLVFSCFWIYITTVFFLIYWV